MHRVKYASASSLARIVATTLFSSQAMAGGFQIDLDSVPLMSRAFAGSASAPDDAVVVNSNPAAMSMFTSTTVQSAITAVDYSAKFTGGGHDAQGLPLTGGNGGDAGGTTPIPALQFIMPIGNGFTLGASVTSPFGLKTQYDPGWVGRYQALTSELKTFDLTLAGAYQFNTVFSVGAGLIVQRADASLSKAIDFGAILASAGLAPAFLPQSADGSSKVKGNDTALGWETGLLFHPQPSTSVGLNYRAKISHTIEGTADFTVPPPVQGVFTQVGSPYFQDQAASARVTTPAVANFSITQMFSDRFSLSFDAQRTQWDSTQELRIKFAGPDPDSVEQFNWRNTTLLALGTDWKLSDTLTLRAGMARDQSPTNDANRDPSLPERNRQLYSIGLGWSTSKNASWSIGYMHIAVDKPTVNEVSPTGSTLVGSFDASVNILGFAGTLAF